MGINLQVAKWVSLRLSVLFQNHPVCSSYIIFLYQYQANAITGLYCVVTFRAESPFPHRSRLLVSRSFLWSPPGIARGTLLHARVGRHLPTNAGTHSSIPAKAGVAFCCRGKSVSSTYFLNCFPSFATFYFVLSAPRTVFP